MSRLVQITCDAPGCANQKHEANHWWRVGILETRIIIVPTDSPAQFNKNHQVFDFCGRECALKFVSEQMGKVASK